MVRYWYAGTPLLIVGAVLLLALPWLALFALAIGFLVALVALAGLAWGLVSVLRMLSRSIRRRWRDRPGASPRTEAVLSPASSGKRRTQSAPAGATALLANPSSRRRHVI
jgi:hypothetical protein